MAKDLAIVLNNGSLNSAVATALAGQKHRVVLVHADGNSAVNSRGRAAFEQQANHFKPYRWHMLPMPYLANLQGTENTAAQMADPRQGAPLGPRLLNLLPIMGAGAAFAASYQAAAIYLGLRVGGGADDLAQATEFIQVFNELVQLACGQKELEVVAPLLELEAWQVVELGFQVNAPLELGWSCAEDGPVPCGACRGCRHREAAFIQAAKPDPLRTARKNP